MVDSSAFRTERTQIQALWPAQERQRPFQATLTVYSISIGSELYLEEAEG